MSLLDALNPVGAIVESVGKVASDLITTDKERLQLENDAYKLETERLSTQTGINEKDAQSEDWFQRRWRPAAGWVCVLGLAYQFLLHPLLTWCWSAMQAAHIVSIGLLTPPPLDVEYLLSLLMGMLGIGGMRSFDKAKMGK